jgi:formylglycine-generating enzyme required for sulfatase activity
MVVMISIAGSALAQQAAPESTKAGEKKVTSLPASITVDIPTSAYKMNFVLVPGDPAAGIKPFYLSTTEVTWDAFDVYLYRLDDPNAPPVGKGPDAVTHPSKSYLPPDRGFGHEKYAAITISQKNARAFCEWLTKKSGKKVRLASSKEWTHACTLGDAGASQFTPATAKEFAWFANNADGKTHEVGTLKPNALGIYDMHGNVAEWVTGPDDAPGTMGGSYQETVEEGVKAAKDMTPYNPDWNGSDPQIPKSKWWLSDGPMVGFRAAIEAEENAEIPANTPKSEPTVNKPASKPVSK